MAALDYYLGHDGALTAIRSVRLSLVSLTRSHFSASVADSSMGFLVVGHGQTAGCSTTDYLTTDVPVA